MEKTKPLSKETKKKESKNESQNYPTYWDNPGLFVVRCEYAENLFESIYYHNQPNDLRKWYCLSKDCIKDPKQREFFLNNFEPSNMQIFDKTAREGLAWLADHVAKYGYSLAPVGTTETEDITNSNQ